jgi:hypothetical protein
MNFEHEFQLWLARAVGADIPGAVRAFSFNLFEPSGSADARFAIELVGTGEFDPSDSDWATEEVWEPRARHLLIPTHYSGETWQICLARLTQLVARTLQDETPTTLVLRSREAVAIGFVDGDLSVLWQRTP